MKNTKIVCIIDPVSSEPKYGGFSRQYDYAKALSNDGYQIIVISSGFSHFLHSYISEEKILVNEINPSFHYAYLRTTSYHANNGIGRFINMISFFCMVLANGKKLFKQYGEPDVIIGSSPHQLSWIAAEILSRKCGSKFCVDVRDFWPRIWVIAEEKSKWNPIVIISEALQRHSFKNADKIFHSMKGGDGYICGELGFPKEKTCWIGQPIDCKRFDKNKAKKEQIPNEIREFIQGGFVCTYAGYYMTYEGVYVMLRAARLLKEKGLPIKMVFVGSGNEKEGMLQYVQENALDNVLIYDRIEKETVPALLASSDICLAHLEVEGHKETYKYGVSKNKIVEYLYSGACTLYGFSYPNEVSESGGGFLFEPHNEKSLADAIEHVYELSAEERREIAKCGIDYIKREHSVEELAKKLEEAIS